MLIMDAHGCLFNRIAGAYQWFFRWQKRHYQEKVDKILEWIHLPYPANILDIGCGTGAFGYVFQERGFEVIGVDIAPNMVKKGIKNQVHCIVGNIETGLPFPDHKFDLVISAFMFHGLSAGDRYQALKEAQRLTKNIILIYDYTSPSTSKSRGIRLIEKLEGGYYLEFLQAGMEEMKKCFSAVIRQEESENTSFYILKSV